MTGPREITTNRRFAIIVAIENYRKSGSSSITKVKYAKNDAEKFRNILINEFGFLSEEVVLFLEQDAVKAAFENDIPYHISQLSSEYQFIFYYVGHGFYMNGDNKLTCWDSHPFNLSQTCVSLKEFLFDPLLKCDCKKSLIFLDCCSADLKDHLTSRDVLADLNMQQFEDFIMPDDYHAVFMSCSPGEKSYSSDSLKHGIWTWHLTEALSGRKDGAIVNDIFITDTSLQNFLSLEVPRFITKETEIRGSQRPFAKIHAKNDFLIRKIPKPEIEIDEGLPNFRFNYSKAIFRKIDYEDIKRADGFKKGYSVPKWKNANAVKFVQTIFKSEVEEDIQQVYERTKDTLKLRSSDIDYSIELEGGYVKCEYFRYYLDVTLDEDNLSKAKIIRRLQIRVPRNRLPDNFDSIFEMYLNELIIPIEGDLVFSDIVNQFENLKEEHGGTLRDQPSKGTMEYITPRGTSITINANENELIITHYSPMRSLTLIDKSIEDLRMISSYKIKLLGSKN